jgi:hypothetical protein
MAKRTNRVAWGLVAVLAVGVVVGVVWLALSWLARLEAAVD